MDKNFVLELYEAGIEDGIYRGWAYDNTDDDDGPSSINEFMMD